MASAFKRVAGYLGLMDEDEVDHGNNQLTERAPRLVRSTAKPVANQMLNFCHMQNLIKLWTILFL